MALYREGKAAMSADGTVTGTGTKWQSSLSLIRPGATIMFLSSPIQMAVVNKVVSDTEIKAITTSGAVVSSTDYAILLSDSLTVDGLAQDVAETLRYYQSQEAVIADAVDFFKDFDLGALQNLANQVKADSEAAGASAVAAAASESASKTSETNAKASENAAKTSEVVAETARDQVQRIIDDAGEQSTLVVLAQPTGAGKSGVLQGGTVQDALQYVTPEMMRVGGDKYLHGITADAVPFLQAALDYGHVNNLPVRWSTVYPCIAAPVEFNLPFDDGTVYPGWVGSGDENIAPETPVKAKAHLRAYDNTVIIGDNHHTCGIIGTFSKAAGPWNHSSAMGIYLAGDNGTDQYIKYHFSGIGISSCFIGLWVDGTVDRCTEDNIRISGCAIPACYQGSDSLAQTGLTHYRSNLGGPVFGGRWLTRNHAYASTYLPPYPASDIHRAGWNDSYHAEKFHYYGDTSLDWDHPAYAAVDAWFDTYVFKSANSAKTSDGGRLSNNQQSGVYPVDTYKGVTGRARTIYSRYGREILHCNISEAKVLWSPRTPFHQSAQFVGANKSYVGNSKIGTVILERVGIIKYSLGDVAGNRFNVDNVDPYEPSLTAFPAMATRGNIFALDIVKGGAVQTTVVNEFTGTTIGAGMNLVAQRKSGDTSNHRLLGLQELNGANLSDRIIFNRNDCYMQPTMYPGGNNAQFKYWYGTFTPTVTIAGSGITLTEATGVYHRFGDIIRIHIRLRNSSLNVATAGPIAISGLPFAAGTVQVGYTRGNVFTGAATGKTLTPLVAPGGTTMSILVDSAGATFQHPAGAIDFTLHAEFDYVLPFNS